MTTRPGAVRLLAVGAALLIGCGGSATSPTPPSELTGTWSGGQLVSFTAIYVGTNLIGGSACGGSLRLEAQGAVLSGYYQVNPPCTGEGAVTGTVASAGSVTLSLPGRGPTNAFLEEYLNTCELATDSGRWVGTLNTVSVLDLTRTLGLNCPTSGRVTMVEEFHGTR